MYATPVIKPIAMDAESASCCDVYVTSRYLFLGFRNPICGPVVQQFPTCDVSIQNPATGQVLPSLCVIQGSVETATPAGGASYYVSGY